MTKKSRQKLKYFENEKSFWGEIKSIFSFWKGFQLPKMSQIWECTFKMELFLFLWSFICHVVNIGKWKYVFTCVIIEIEVFHLCCTCTVCVALVSQLCGSCLTHIALVLLVPHLRCTCVTRACYSCCKID